MAVSSVPSPSIRKPVSRLAKPSNRYPRTPDQTIIDTEKWFAGKSFSTADGTGAMHRRFLFVIVQKDDPSQEIIGTVGVNSLSPAPSIGYGLHPGFWGRGYASEAVGGLLGAWGSLLRAEDGKRGREKMYACCNRENVGSVRVLQKNGFTNYDEVEMEGDRVAFWELELGE